MLPGCVRSPRGDSGDDESFSSSIDQLSRPAEAGAPSPIQGILWPFSCVFCHLLSQSMRARVRTHTHTPHTYTHILNLSPGRC